MQIEVKNLGFYYSKNKWIIRNVNFSVASGEKVGLVGPSGYGKSTLVKLIAGYMKPREGEILVDGKTLPKKGYCPIQMIYQHPEKAVDPYWTMGKILNEGWRPDQELLDDLGIEDGWLKRHPSELSGGEMQRFCIARSLGPGTKFLLADEISTMLDSITQAQVWNLLLKQIEKRDLGMIIVTHNRDLAAQVCDRVLDLRELNRV